MGGAARAGLYCLLWKAVLYSDLSRAELYGRTSSNILDLALTFDELGVRNTIHITHLLNCILYCSVQVSIPDLEEYVQHFEIAPARDIAPYPTPCKVCSEKLDRKLYLFLQEDLNHLKPGSREVLTRPIHVHDHLPAMYPELETDESGEGGEGGAGAGEEGDLSADNNTQHTSLVSPVKGRGGVGAGGGAGAGSSGAGELPKQPDDGCPLREISSVMMTSSGFLSPCREGKLPDRQRIHVPQDPDDRKVTQPTNWPIKH